MKLGEIAYGAHIIWICVKKKYNMFVADIDNWNDIRISYILTALIEKLLFGSTIAYTHKLYTHTHMYASLFIFSLFTPPSDNQHAYTGKLNSNLDKGD